LPQRMRDGTHQRSWPVGPRQAHRSVTGSGTGYRAIPDWAGHYGRRIVKNYAATKSLGSGSKVAPNGARERATVLVCQVAGNVSDLA